MSKPSANVLDLNLFKVLVVLLERRSVSLAAAELALTPSAVSHALGRLRSALNDPLFERRGGGLAPTPYALEVGRRVRPALEQLSAATEPLAFDPMTTEREFSVGVGSYSAMVTIPLMLRMLERNAPGLRLRVERLEPHYVEDVERGRLDLAFGVVDDLSAQLGWIPVLQESVVWTARIGHPFVHAPVTLEMLARARHVIVEQFNVLMGAEYAQVQRYLDDAPEIGKAYKAARLQAPLPAGPAVVVTDSVHALAIVRESDCVTLTLRGLAETIWAGELQILSPPHHSPKIEIGAMYNRDRLRDPGFAWMVNAIATASWTTARRAVAE